jgi:hypothetical protein
MPANDYEGYHYEPGVPNTKTYHKPLPVITINEFMQYEKKKRPARSENLKTGVFLTDQNSNSQLGFSKRK